VQGGKYSLILYFYEFGLLLAVWLTLL